MNDGFQVPIGSIAPRFILDLLVVTGLEPISTLAGCCVRSPDAVDDQG